MYYIVGGFPTGFVLELGLRAWVSVTVNFMCRLGGSQGTQTRAQTWFWVCPDDSNTRVRNWVKQTALPNGAGVVYPTEDLSRTKRLRKRESPCLTAVSWVGLQCFLTSPCAGTPAPPRSPAYRLWDWNSRHQLSRSPGCQLQIVGLVSLHRLVGYFRVTDFIDRQRDRHAIGSVSLGNPGKFNTLFWSTKWRK